MFKKVIATKKIDGILTFNLKCIQGVEARTQPWGTPQGSKLIFILTFNLKSN